MDNIVWKSFFIGNLFLRSTTLSLSKNQKDLNLSESFDENHRVALISASRSGSGCVGYLSDNDYDTNQVSINKITFDDQWGYTYFQDEKFVITGGHNAILEVIDNNLKELLDKHLNCYKFLSKSINKATIKSNIYGYGYKINNKLDREIILLPLLETTKEDSIWELDGKYYTLAVEYIEKLVNKAKETIEERTINSYKQQKDEQINNSLIYKDLYSNQINTVIWKSFRLGDIFDWSSRKDLSLKNYNFIDHFELDYVEVVTGSMSTNNKYVKITDLPDNYPIYKNCLSFNTNGSIGHCFYYNNPIISPTSSVHILIHKNNKLEKIMSEILNWYVARQISNIFINGLYGYTYLIDKDKFDREIILLPLLETTKAGGIWEIDGKYYTLAVDVISYLYYIGRINMYDNKIKNYKCVY